MNDRDHEFTPREIRSNRIQALLILLPMLVAAVVLVVRVVG